MPPKKATSSKAAEPAHDFKTGEIVLCKVKGYPEWPGKITEHSEASDLVMKSKGNKQWLVRFFPDGDFHWAIPKEMKYLAPKDIEAYLSDTSKKNGKLRKSYEIAKDPSEWEEQIKKGVPAGGEDVDEEEDEDVDMLDEDGEGKSKKRKRAAATKKEPAAKKEKKEPAAKKRKTDDKKDSKAAKDKKGSTSAAEGDASQGEKTAKGWRASLQKAFLTKGLPTEDKMPEFDQILSAMEKFEMQAEWLAASKLGKVLKRMSALTDVPRDSEFKITERSGALVEKWKELMAKDGEEPSTADGGNAGDMTVLPDDDKKPEENGDAAAPAEDATKDGEKTNGDAAADEKMDVEVPVETSQTNGAEA